MSIYYHSNFDHNEYSKQDLILLLRKMIKGKRLRCLYRYVQYNTGFCSAEKPLSESSFRTIINEVLCDFISIDIYKTKQGNHRVVLHCKDLDTEVLYFITIYSKKEEKK